MHVTLGVRTVRGRPEGFLLTKDAVVLNCVTQFNIVWRVRTFPFLPMSKCRRKTRCVTVVEPLFLKNVSTANARCSTDQRCMMTEGFKLLYPAMYVSLHHLHRCRHGAKFKSSNGFCPTVAEPLFLKKHFHSKRSMLNRPMMHDDWRLQTALPSDVCFTAPPTQMSAWR